MNTTEELNKWVTGSLGISDNANNMDLTMLQSRWIYVFFNCKNKFCMIEAHLFNYAFNPLNLSIYWHSVISDIS